MADPRGGRASFGGYSPRLGRRDPRPRMSQTGAVTDNDLDQQTVARDHLGRQRISVADQLKPLPANATLAETRAAYNQLLKKLKGQ